MQNHTMFVFDFRFFVLLILFASSPTASLISLSIWSMTDVSSIK